MSSIPSGWLPFLFTTLGAGVVGAVITTYGAQRRIRRETRSRALETLERIEAARYARGVNEVFSHDHEAFAELEARCMVAGVPRRLVYWFNALSQAAAGTRMPLGPMAAIFNLISYSAFLTRQSLWHPYLCKISQPFQLRRLRRAVDRCSKIDTMVWLSDIQGDQGPMRFRHVRSWVKAVENSDPDDLIRVWPSRPGSSG
jgi:hypothetical protein